VRESKFWQKRTQLSAEERSARETIEKSPSEVEDSQRVPTKVGYVCCEMNLVDKCLGFNLE